MVRRYGVNRKGPLIGAFARDCLPHTSLTLLLSLDTSRYSYTYDDKYGGIMTLGCFSNTRDVREAGHYLARDDHDNDQISLTCLWSRPALKHRILHAAYATNQIISTMELKFVMSGPDDRRSLKRSQACQSCRKSKVRILGSWSSVSRHRIWQDRILTSMIMIFRTIIFDYLLLCFVRGTLLVHSTTSRHLQVLHWSISLGFMQ